MDRIEINRLALMQAAHPARLRQYLAFDYSLMESAFQAPPARSVQEATTEMPALRRKGACRYDVR